MVDILKINVDASRVYNALNRIRYKLPAEIGKESNKFTKDIARSIRANAPSWTGKLKQSIKATPQGKNVFVVKMIKYGEYLDADMVPHQKSHVISLKKGRKITRWSQDKGIFQMYGMPIRVHAHPFIRAPVRMELAKLRNRLRRAASRGIRK